MARKEGFVEVDEMLKEIGVNTMITRTIKESPLVNVIHDEPYSLVFSFDYHGETYYYKFTDYKEISPYNELIAEELAHDFGIPCVDYDLAVLGDIREGNISKDYKRPDANYLTGQDILYSFYSKTMNFGDSFLDENRYNSLENIWDALEYRYQLHPDKREVVRSLMEKLVNIYLFDVLVCQSDRHSGNWMIEEKENNIDIAPIFDNERLYPDLYCYYPGINVEFCEDDPCKIEDDLLYKSLESFKKVSNENYLNIIKDKLWIIGEENLNKVFERIEAKTEYPMPEGKKKYYLDGYQKHQDNLKKILNIEDIRKR